MSRAEDSALLCNQIREHFYEALAAFLLVYRTKIRHRVGLLCFLRSGRSSQRGNEAKQSLGFHFSNVTGMQTCRRDPEYLPPGKPNRKHPAVWRYPTLPPAYPPAHVSHRVWSCKNKQAKLNIQVKLPLPSVACRAGLSRLFLTVGLVKIPTLVKSAQ